ncbi:MAG TPA: DinB family protein [Vicinamibacterales bacterium]
MTYYGAGDLAASFRQVRSNTIQIAEEIPEDKYSFRAAPDTRSAGQTLVHIALAPGLQLHLHRNRIGDLQSVNFAELVAPRAAEETRPRTKAEIVVLLESERDVFASYLEGLTEAFLAEAVKMPPGAQPATKTRFEMLMSVKEHEMHHRGQLMVLQRMMGLTPHLTRQMQERMARRAAEAQAAR